MANNPWPPRVAFGEEATAALIATIPGGVLDVAKKTSNQNNIDTSETDITGLSITVSCVAGRTYRVQGKVRMNPDNDPMEIIARLYVGATQLDSDSWRTVVVSEDHRMNLLATYDCTSSGSKTFKITGQSLTGSTTFDCTASSITPGLLLVEDIGPTP